MLVVRQAAQDGRGAERGQADALRKQRAEHLAHRISRAVEQGENVIEIGLFEQGGEIARRGHIEADGAQGVEHLVVIDRVIAVFAMQLAAGGGVLGKEQDAQPILVGGGYREQVDRVTHARAFTRGPRQGHEFCACRKSENG